MKVLDDGAWATRRVELPSDYVRVVEDALTLLRAEKLSAKKLARLSSGDVDLMRIIAEQNGPLPGSVVEVAAVRKLSREALVLLLADSLDEPISSQRAVPKATKTKPKPGPSKAKAKKAGRSKEDKLDPYWYEQLREHQAAELISFAADVVREGNHNSVAIIARADADRDLLVRARAKGQEYVARMATGAVGHPAERELMQGANAWKGAVELMSAAILKYDDGVAEGKWA